MIPVVRGAGADVALSDWLRAHGIPEARIQPLLLHGGDQPDAAHQAVTESMCHAWPAGVTAPAPDAILCTTENFVQALMQGVTHARVFVPRGNAAAKVLDVILSISAIDFAEKRWVDLAVAMNADGSVSVTDRAPTGTVIEEGGLFNPPVPILGCDEGLRGVRDFLKVADAAERPFVTKMVALTEKTCDGRGHWTWRANRFVKDRP
jgi:hypothetical protein